MTKTITAISRIKYLEVFNNLSDRSLITVLPSITTKLEIALIKVSIVLKVKLRAKIITKMLSNGLFGLINNLKNDKSGLVVLSMETETKPE